MGKSKAKEMLFWTKDEYMKFAEVMKEKPASYYAFQLLYWGGMRCGELLALSMSDFDLDKKILHIHKNYQVVKGQEIIITPKSEKGNRLARPLILRFLSLQSSFIRLATASFVFIYSPPTIIITIIV